VSAQLANGNFESRSRPQRRLVEEQRDMAAAERIRRRRMTAERAVGLQLRGELQTPLQIRRIEIEDGQEVFVRLRRRRFCSHLIIWSFDHLVIDLVIDFVILNAFVGGFPNDRITK
jgi:hypothetical protein